MMGTIQYHVDDIKNIMRLTIFCFPVVCGLPAKATM